MGLEEILQYRLETLEKAVQSIDESLKALADQRIEVDHIRKDTDQAHENIRIMDSRLKTVEIALPGLQEVRQWVIWGVIGTIAIVGTGVIAMVLKQ